MFGVNFVKKTVWLEELNPVLKTVLSRKNYIYPGKSTLARASRDIQLTANSRAVRLTFCIANGR